MPRDSSDPDCLSCGICCAPPERWKSFVEVTRQDQERLPAPYRLRIINGELAARRRPGGIRCIALEGKLGKQVQCAIHESRPETCRRFIRGSGACLKARYDYFAETR